MIEEASPVWHSGVCWGGTATRASGLVPPRDPATSLSLSIYPIEVPIADNSLCSACLDREPGKGRKPASLFTVELHACRSCFRREEADPESRVFYPTPATPYPSFATHEVALTQSLLDHYVY